MPKKKIKVIFLDIDGVMNSHVFAHERYISRSSKLKRLYYRMRKKIKWVFNGFKHKHEVHVWSNTPDSHYTFNYQFKRLRESTCPQKWKWLSEWCNENDIKICISSVWKNHFGTREQGKPEWWDKALTELGFKSDTYVGITGARRTLRGEEISDYLKAYSNIEDYAILDDDSDMLPEQFIKFHHCDGWFGMSPNHLYRIKRQFDGENSYENLIKTI